MDGGNSYSRCYEDVLWARGIQDTIEMQMGLSKQMRIMGVEYDKL